MADEGWFKEQLKDIDKKTEIDIRYTKLSADQVKRLGAALHPRVVKLVLWNCGLGDSGAASLAASWKGCTALTRTSTATKLVTLAPRPWLPR